MNRQWKRVVLLGVLLASNTVMAAELSHTQIKDTGQDSSHKATNVLSVTDLAHARLWGLSETEWRRYKQLMQGIRGSISPSTISPIEVLGIHARDDAERQRYAEVWALSLIHI